MIYCPGRAVIGALVSDSSDTTAFWYVWERTFVRAHRNLIGFVSHVAAMISVLSEQADANSAR